MSKNKTNLILYGFIGCLFITVLVLVIKIASRPEQAIKDINKNDNVVADNKKDEDTISKPDDVTAGKDNEEDMDKPDASTEDKNDKEDNEEDKEPSKTANVKKMVTVKEANTNVNVRSQPDTSSTKLGKIEAGESYEFLGEQDAEWTKIMFNDQEAYVYTTYIKIVEVEE